MARDVIWSKRSEHNFNSVIAYLESGWGERVTSNFVKEVYNIIDLIELNPDIGKPAFRGHKVRSFVITKHNTLFYRVNKTHIIILNIFDNRQGTSRRKF